MTENEILKLEHSLIQAIKKSDVNALDILIHNDLLFLTPNGQYITKAVDLASHEAGEMVVEELYPTFEQINVVGDTAIVVMTYDTKGKMLNQPIDGKYRYIRIWKKFSDGIKIIAGSCYKL